jgi:hypothetical protein
MARFQAEGSWEVCQRAGKSRKAAVNCVRLRHQELGRSTMTPLEDTTCFHSQLQGFSVRLKS